MTSGLVSSVMIINKWNIELPDSGKKLSLNWRVDEILIAPGEGGSHKKERGALVPFRG